MEAQGFVMGNAAGSCNHNARGWNRTLHPTPALPRELSDGCGLVPLLGFWTVGRQPLPWDYFRVVRDPPGTRSPPSALAERIGKDNWPKSACTLMLSEAI